MRNLRKFKKACLKDSKRQLSLVKFPGAPAIIIATFLCCCIFPQKLMAQNQLSVYTDLGVNNVSNGLFIKTEAFYAYQSRHYKFESGMQVNLKSNFSKNLSGYSVQLTRTMLLKKRPLSLSLYMVNVPVSDEFRQLNIGFMAGSAWRHFSFKTGLNSRTYSFHDRESGENATPARRIHEVWTAMYAFTYSLKTAENIWNLSATLTDFDNFIINQETSPQFKISGSYKLKHNLTLYAESNITYAGAMNTNVNFFGLFTRTGFIWKLN